MNVPASTLTTIGEECQALARYLGNWQNQEFALQPRYTVRLVNALLNAGNIFTQMVADGGKIQPESVEPVSSGALTQAGLRDLTAPPKEPSGAVPPPLEGYGHPDPSV